MIETPPFDFEFAVTADSRQLQSNQVHFGGLENVLFVYMAARQHYLAGDVGALEHLIETYMKRTSRRDWLAALMEMRLSIRRKSAHPREAQTLAVLAEVRDPHWQSEICMVLGMYFEELNRYEDSESQYRSSAQLFASVGMTAKSLTAEYNSLIARTLSKPNGRYLVAYRALADKALAVGYKSLSGTILANIAREYQLLGLDHLACENAELAYEQLKDGSYGTSQYFLTAAQLLDLYLTLGRHKSAPRLYEELLSSPYRDVEEIVKVLNRHESEGDRQGVASGPIDLAVLPAPWRERLTPVTVDEPISDLEERIVGLLSSERLQIRELATALYGDKIDPDSALARAKQALYRLRKKRPGLIAFRKGKYELFDCGS